MSVTQQITETAITFAPDQAPDSPAEAPTSIGKPVNRVDGALKVRGEATFSAEFQFENIACAALVYSTIAKGAITRIDQSAAEHAPGVLAIMTHQNAPALKAPPGFGGPEGGAAGSTLPVMQSDRVFWNGQPVAVVVAETQEQAEYAASLMHVRYQEEPAAVSFDSLKANATVPPAILGEQSTITIGDAEAGLRDTACKVDQMYRTPRQNPSAIELHTTIAIWGEGSELTVYDSTQNLPRVKTTLCVVFDLAPEQVRVIAPFVGGGFGGKVMLWDNTLLCVMAAKLVGRPLKLVLSREGTFRAVGARALSEQRVALGVHPNGKLRSLIHSGTTAVVSHTTFFEQFSFPARHLYASESFLISQKIVSLDMVANTSVRAPGDAIGTFALESAMDELAHTLHIDPIELRRINEPAKDPLTGKPFSSRNMIEAYQRGAERFGWASRNSEPRSQRDGKWLVGQGVASAYYPYFRFPGSARLRLSADGTARVQAAAHETGMGTATVQIQHAADRLGLPIDRVSFEYGDSNLPSPYTAGGSSQTASIVAAVAAVVDLLHNELLALVGEDSPLAGATSEQIEARDGRLFRKGDAGGGETYAAILRRAGRDHVEVEARSAAPSEMMEYSMHSYGAQFCEVRVNDQTGEVRISRWLGSFDCGRILNAKTAQSQLRGAIVMGIGLALTEEPLFDERHGRIVNPSLAEYHVPVHLDIPRIDIIYTDIPDEHAPLGVHGLGEIGSTGVAAAIANAVFNATGKRVRKLPITLDMLL